MVVDSFDAVVASLIEAVNVPLYLGNFSIRGMRTARFIFFVPKLEIEGMLLAGNLQQARVRIADRAFMPKPHGIVVHFYNFSGGKPRCHGDNPMITERH
jgi:hypothetical protein